MAKAAFWFGLFGLAAGVLSCIAMFLLTLLAMFFVPLPGWFFLAYVGLLLVSGVGFAGAVDAQKRPGEATVSMFIAAIPWALASAWVMSESAVILTLPPTVLFALGSLFGWIDHWQRQETAVPDTGVV